MEAQAFTDIFLPIGRHAIKHLAYFNATGAIRGVSVANDTSPTEDICIESMEDDSVLFVINENFQLENVTLDCRKVRTGLLLRNGDLTLKNCTLIGDEKSNPSNGFVALGTFQVFVIRT